jgi:hypothetical protein
VPELPSQSGSESSKRESDIRVHRQNGAQQQAYKAFSQQSCHQGPFDNRRDFGTNRSEEPDPHAAFAEIAFDSQNKNTGEAMFGLRQ